MLTYSCPSELLRGFASIPHVLKPPQEKETVMDKTEMDIAFFFELIF